MEEQTLEQKNLPENDSKTPLFDANNDQKTQVSEPKRYKFKLGEQEEEFLEDDLTELIKAGRDAALTKKEAHELKQVLDLLKANPRQFLSDPKHGVDLYKLAEEAILERVEQEKLTPEQRKLQEYEQKFKEIEEREKADKEKKEQDELTAAETKWVEHYDKTFFDALQVSGLPKTPRTIKRMAELTMSRLDQGQETDSKTLAEIVREDFLADIKELLGSSDEDALLQLLGEDIEGKVRKAGLKRLKTPLFDAKSTQKSPISRSKPEQPQKLNADEWRERMERIKRGLE